MYTIRKKFKFEMAHALIDSYTVGCRTIHGHSYVLELFISSDKLNDKGMVVDFTELKDKLGTYINSWDHILVLKDDDKRWKSDEWDLLTRCKVKHVSYIPTAENMCKVMYENIKYMIKETMDSNVGLDAKWIIKVRLHETDTGYAEYTE